MNQPSIYYAYSPGLDPTKARVAAWVWSDEMQISELKTIHTGHHNAFIKKSHCPEKVDFQAIHDTTSITYHAVSGGPERFVVHRTASSAAGMFDRFRAKREQIHRFKDFCLNAKARIWH